MSSSTHSHKFLLDENVKIQLFKNLKEKGFDVKPAPKSAADKELALISKREKRVLVTNDEDFTWYTKEQLFALIWLRVSQADTESLIQIFSKLSNQVKSFDGKLITLKSDGWDEDLLFEEVAL